MTSKNKPGGSSSRANTAGSRKDKHSSNKNGKKSDGPSGSSFFTWFMIIALLGVWSSVAVVWFDLVDYEDVLAKAKEFRYNLSEVLQGKLAVYDADGDGDFDVEDAKVLLGLKEVERPVPAEHFGKNEEPIQPSVHTTIETEAIEGEEPPTEERRNEFDAEGDDSEDAEAADEVEYGILESEPEEADTPDESKMVEEEMMYEQAESPEESEYVEDETLSEGAEIREDSGPEVVDVPEDKIPESEVREEEVYDYTVSDEAELEPEEVVSEHVPGIFESDVEEDLFDQVDSEDGMEEELPMSDEFIEENEVPKPEDTVEEFYAEDPEYIPETEDIQEVSPVLEKTDEDSPSAAVPLPEAVEELITEEEDDTLEGTEEHPAKEEEYVNYAEVSEPSEPDHLEVTEEAIGATGLQEDTSDETVSLSEDKLKEMSSDL